MQSYLLQVAYTAEAWKALVKDPQNRIDKVRPVVEKLGGRMQHSWFAFGDYDIVAIMEMPDNVSAAAFSLAASAGGSIRTIKTTALLSMEEGVDAMRKAGKSGYKPVKS